MGQNMHLARYPIHWHLIGDAQGQYIKNSAVHDTYSRCVTVHGTNYLDVENNVTYNNIGHCFFLEDGVEHDNQFVHNLGILTKCHPDAPCDPTNLAMFGSTDGTNFKTAGQNAKDILLPSDNTASTFWITNPDNIYRDNVAAGSDSTGFWFALPQNGTGKFENTEIGLKTWPRRTKVREFKGNTSHSNFDGFLADRGPRPDGHFATGGHMSLSNPADANSPQVESVFEDFTAYKNRNGGLWSRGEMHTYKNLKLADNAIGYTHASGNTGRSAFTSRVVDSLFVGETENIGNPRTPEEKAYGRSLPEPKVADFPIRGYEYYDFRHELDNVTFVNYQDNATRKTGAISYLLFTSFGMSSNNTIQRAKFVNAKPVYFPPMEYKWSNDDYGSGSYRSSVFHDKDGSVGGVPNSFIVINGGIPLDEACEVKPTWNAAVCKGDVGRMNIGAGGGGGGGRGGAPGGRGGGCSRCCCRSRRSGRTWRTSCCPWCCCRSRRSGRTWRTSCCPWCCWQFAVVLVPLPQEPEVAAIPTNGPACGPFSNSPSAASSTSPFSVFASIATLASAKSGSIARTSSITLPFTGTPISSCAGARNATSGGRSGTTSTVCSHRLRILHVLIVRKLQLITVEQRPRARIVQRQRESHRRLLPVHFQPAVQLAVAIEIDRRRTDRLIRRRMQSYLRPFQRLQIAPMLDADRFHSGVGGILIVHAVDHDRRHRHRGDAIRIADRVAGHDVVLHILLHAPLAFGQRGREAVSIRRHRHRNRSIDRLPIGRGVQQLRLLAAGQTDNLGRHLQRLSAKRRGAARLNIADAHPPRAATSDHGNITRSIVSSGFFGDTTKYSANIAARPTSK